MGSCEGEAVRNSHRRGRTKHAGNGLLAEKKQILKRIEEKEPQGCRLQSAVCSQHSKLHKTSEGAGSTNERRSR
jgi:hypothetical protein